MPGEEERLAQFVAHAGPMTGRASADDGAVSVEVGVGGRLTEVKLDQRALRYGASYLCESVLTAARKATALANQRAHQVYLQALGSKGDKLLDELGVSYDPALLNQDEQHQPTRTQARRPPAPPAGQPSRRPRPVEEDDPADYPETWLQ